MHKPSCAINIVHYSEKVTAPAPLRKINIGKDTWGLALGRDCEFDKVLVTSSNEQPFYMDAHTPWRGHLQAPITVEVADLYWPENSFQRAIVLSIDAWQDPDVVPLEIRNARVDLKHYNFGTESEIVPARDVVGVAVTGATVGNTYSLYGIVSGAFGFIQILLDTFTIAAGTVDFYRAYTNLPATWIRATLSLNDAEIIITSKDVY